MAKVGVLCIDAPSSARRPEGDSVRPVLDLLAQGRRVRSIYRQVDGFDELARRPSATPTPDATHHEKAPPRGGAFKTEQTCSGPL